MLVCYYVIMLVWYWHDDDDDENERSDEALTTKTFHRQARDESTKWLEIFQIQRIKHSVSVTITRGEAHLKSEKIK